MHVCKVVWAGGGSTKLFLRIESYCTKKTFKIYINPSIQFILSMLYFNFLRVGRVVPVGARPVAREWYKGTCPPSFYTQRGYIIWDKKKLKEKEKEWSKLA